jgi:hypothetical protein
MGYDALDCTYPPLGGTWTHMEDFKSKLIQLQVGFRLIQAPPSASKFLQAVISAKTAPSHRLEELVHTWRL